MPRTRSYSQNPSRSPSQRASAAASYGQHVTDRRQPELGETLLKLRPDERQVGERKRREERALVACVDDVYASRAGSRLRFRALDRELRDQLRRPAADRDAVSASPPAPPVECGAPSRRATRYGRAPRCRRGPCTIRRCWPTRPWAQNRSSTARISRCLREHAPRGTGTHIACGQSRSAREMGIALRTPNLRVSYDALHTTPRLSRVPPTMSSSARPAPSGSTMRAMAT